MKKATEIASRLVLRIVSQGLVLGAPALLASAALVACADESDPATWAKRVEDPAQRVTAIKRLEEMFNSGMSDTKNDREDPKVKRVLDAAVEPLAKAYTGGGLDEKTRKELMKLLADMGDPRAAPAYAKALKDFEAGKNEEEVRFAAVGATSLAKNGKLTDQALIDAVWECFAKLQPTKVKSSNLFKDVQTAVVTVKHPSYGPKAVEKLSAAVTDPKKPEDGLDQIQYWQATSARLIGELKYTPGVKQLVKVLLTPQKADLVFPVRLALTKMPKEAEPVLIAAIKGTDPELAQLAAAYPEKAYLPRVGEPLAYIGRPAGRDAIMEALATADSDQNRTILASYLTHFPSDAKSVKAYLDAYAKVAPNAAIALMGGSNAHAVLAQSSANFFDPSIVDWLVKETAAAKGEAADAMPPAALSAAIKLMDASSKKTVEAAVAKIPGQALEKDMFKAASATLDKCGKDVSCYVAVLDTPIPSSPPTAKMGHVKAAWMAGILGDAKTRTDLVSRVEKVRDGSVRLAMVEAVDHLSPQGDAAAADKLEKIVEADRASNVNAATDEVYKVALKLRSRVP